jgi:hypothetical protein
MTEEDKTPWYKRPWTWVVAVVTVVGGVLAFLFTLGRRGSVRVTKPKDLELPPRPELDDVVVPDKKDVDTKPKADYDEKKVEPASTIDEAIARANARGDGDG